MAIRRPNVSSRSQRLLLPIIGIGMLAITLVFIISAFDRIPIEGTALGIDWHGLWTNIQSGQVTYSNNRASALLNPPWTALMLMPLGFLSSGDTNHTDPVGRVVLGCLATCSNGSAFGRYQQANYIRQCFAE